MCEEMTHLVSRFAEYLRRSEQQLRCFHKYESQVEGWFKGELFCFLDREKLEGRLANFEREMNPYVGDEHNRIHVDMMLQFVQPCSNHLSNWVELKHWIGRQNEQQFTPSQYFRGSPDRTDSCVYCVERLLTIPDVSDKFILVAFTPNPGSEDWKSGVDGFNNQFRPLSVYSLTNPDDFPEYFFLGLLHVSKGSQR